MSDGNSIPEGEAFVIGVDGGGTRTRARLADARGETRGNGEAGPANPNVNGYAAAQAEIMAAIGQAFQDAQIQPGLVRAACLGIGGVDRPEDQSRMEEWARHAIASRVQVVNDAQVVLAAGSPGNWGIALIAGTGSFAWGRDPEGRVARAGGWGYLIGDEGSGFDLARESLRAITHAVDGRGEPTRLVDAVLRHWNLADARDLIPLIYRGRLMPRDIAQLAPLVLDVSKQGDPVAQRLVSRAGVLLAETVVTVADRLVFGSVEIPVALTGGLLLGSELLRNELIFQLRTRDSRLASIQLVHKPVGGAVNLALKMISA